MIKGKRVLCTILARGGSKGVKGKNKVLINGVPLIAYTIIEAKRSKYIDRIVVSTDDKDIIKIAKKYNVEAPFKRPKKFCKNNSNVNGAFFHLLDWVKKDEGKKYDFIIDLLCTNPLKTSKDIDAVIKKIERTNADSVIGVSKLEEHHPIRIKKIINDRIINFRFKEKPGSTRQSLKPVAYIRNGSIYACRWEKRKKRIGSKNSRPYIMPELKSANIDSKLDLIIARQLIKMYPRNYIKKA